MFKDDKMIGLLTALVLMVAFGTVIQKTGSLPEILDSFSGSGEEQLRLVDDQLTVRADTLSRLDVLGNDKGLEKAQRKGIAVLRAPECGRVFVQEDSLQYFPEAACIGERQLVYTVPQAGPAGAATVVLRVVGYDDAEPAPVVANMAEEALKTADQAKAPESKSADVERVVEPTLAALPIPQLAVARVESETSGSRADQVASSADQNQRMDRQRAPQGQAQQFPAVESARETSVVSATNVEVSAPKPANGPADVVVSDPVASPNAPGDLAAPRFDVDAVAEITVAALEEFSPSVEDLSGPGLLPGEPAAASAEGEGIMIAIVARREPPTDAPPTPHVAAVPEPDLGEILVLAAASPNSPVSVSRGAEVLAGPGTGPGSALSGMPMDRNQPPRPRPRIVPEALEQPDQQPELLATLSPAQPEPVHVSAIQPAPAPQSGQEQQELIAALPPAEAPCVAPPSTAIDIRRGARTVLQVMAPCHAGTVAELRYSGLRFAVPLDGEGRGEITTLGFEANAAALLKFVDGAEVDFDLPFRSISRIQRVALVSDQPISLELSALEFGAEVRSAGHVDRDNPRSFSQVRRAGGGFLNSFRAVGGVGKNVDVYTFWNRAGTSSGVVRLLIDFASRNRDRLEGTCGSGPLASPKYSVLRSDGGQLTHPDLRRLPAVSCSGAERDLDDNRLIGGVIDDLIIK